MWQRRVVAHVARNARSFYNRTREIQNLSQNLLQPGAFINVQGPADCGKSAFVQQTLAKLQTAGTPCIASLDLRLDGFDSADGFVEMLAGAWRPAMNTVLERMTGAAKTNLQDLGVATAQIASIDASGAAWAQTAAAFAASTMLTKPPVETFEQLRRVLDGLFGNTWSLWQGNLHHILWIDEANNLKHLLKFGEPGRLLLRQFLDSLVRWTKQTGLISVVFSSSESFVLNDLFYSATEHVRDRIDHFCIGCFPEKEAREYYAQLTRDSTDAIPFDDVFAVVGGHPMHLRQVFEKRVWLKERGLLHCTPCVKFSYLLETTLHSKARVLGVGVDFDVKQLQCVLNLVHKQKFVYERGVVQALETLDASQKFTPSDAIRAMVRHNLLQYRVNTEESYDMPDHIKDRAVPVISVPSPAAWYCLHEKVKMNRKLLRYK